MKDVFLGLGSNLGDRLKMLQMAIKFLSDNPYIAIINKSTVYETEPVGYIEQPNFLNMVIEIKTSLEPLTLLKYINKVEKKLNRKRDIHWGPRTIDIDILLYDKDIIKNEKLKIPHPLMSQRLFVLIPLAEIYSGEIPEEDYSISQLIELQKKNQHSIKKYKNLSI